MKKTGHKKWCVSAGYIPTESNGDEPAFTSRDELSVLNTGSKEAQLTITVFFEDTTARGPYEVKIEPRRLRKIRVNDLIDPLPVPLGTPYGLLLECDRTVVVQFTKISTERLARARICSTAYYTSE